jgi:cytochrome c5
MSKKQHTSLRIVLLALTVLLPFQLAELRPVSAGMMGHGMTGPGMMGGFPPGSDAASLPELHSEGAQLLQAYCTQCHELPGPGLHTAEEWPAVVGRMNMRMQMMGHMGMTMGGMGMMGRIGAPSERELDAILSYLQQHAQKPIGPELRGALETKAGKAFQAICSQCHALPDPRQHSTQEWPAVVDRMKAHETALRKLVPDETETTQIIGFLRQYAQAAE